MPRCMAACPASAGQCIGIAGGVRAHLHVVSLLLSPVIFCCRYSSWFVSPLIGASTPPLTCTTHTMHSRPNKLPRAQRMPLHLCVSALGPATVISSCLPFFFAVHSRCGHVAALSSRTSHLRPLGRTRELVCWPCVDAYDIQSHEHRHALTQAQGRVHQVLTHTVS